MKRSLRPLLSILFLMVVATLLTFRVTLHHGSFQFRNETPFVIIEKLPGFNETLLKYASIDIGEPMLKEEIEELLEGNFRNHGRHRSFLSSGRYRIDVRARSARGLSVHEWSPEFYRVWLSFRRHLHDWARNRRFQSDIMVELVNVLGDLKGKYDGEKKGRERRYKSCAVVGNNGILLKNEHGSQIDSH